MDALSRSERQWSRLPEKVDCLLQRCLHRIEHGRVNRLTIKEKRVRAMTRRFIHVDQLQNKAIHVVDRILSRRKQNYVLVTLPYLKADELTVRKSRHERAILKGRV